MLYDLLKNLYKHFNTKAVFDDTDIGKMPLDEQKRYLESFPDPRDDYERSWFKFKCFCEYCYYHRKWMLVFYNIGACMAFPIVRLRLSHPPKAIEERKKVEALYENVPRLPNEDILPDVVRERYTNTADITRINYEGIFLNQNAKKICKTLRKRYFFHFYFRLIVMIKLAQFAQYLYDYHPETILFYSCEREFAGPLQTLLCEMEDSKYEACMHGDYLYSLCFAFQRYSMYYTWDEFYNEMFRSLKCAFPTTVYTPEKLKGIARKLDDDQCKYFATYYFSAEDKKSALIIHSIFDGFRQHGLRCKIRPHPRFSDIEMLTEVFSDYEIEVPRAYPLHDSIENSLFIIGLNTTVLSQAYFSGKNVVIDDVSMPEDYLQLDARGYIMIRRPHIILSELIEKVKDASIYRTDYKCVIHDEAGIAKG